MRVGEECKGVSKSAALSHINQRMRYMDAYEEKEGSPDRSLLFVNAWRTLAPADRDRVDTQTFPQNVRERAVRVGSGHHFPALARVKFRL